LSGFTERVLGRGGQGQKGPPPNPSFPLRICVPIVEAAVNRARSKYLRAARKGLWAEVRLDYLETPDLKRLFRSHPGPVIATNRLAAEGGRGQGPEGERRRLLEEALDLGADFLDLELAADAAWRRDLWDRKGPAKIILSWHDFTGTPDTESLEAVFQKMLAAPAEVLKLVTLARQPEDNLRVLSLIPRARAAGREIIAFCMGPTGKWSRVVAPLLGSYLTYAPFTKKGASAPGQLTVNELKRAWRALK
jgi:3-dehydroquinate dehydratase type I